MNPTTRLIPNPNQDKDFRNEIIAQEYQIIQISLEAERQTYLQGRQTLNHEDIQCQKECVALQYQK
jgi:hypothetical protein